MHLLETTKETNKLDKELFKKVYKVPGVEILPKYNFPKGKDHVVVDEFNNILNFCSENYSLVENKKIFFPIEEKLNSANIDFHKQINIYDGAEFRVSYLLKAHKENKLGDLFPKLEIINSYNGQVKFRHSFGWFRLVCTNGLTRPHGETNIQVSKHSADLTEASLLFLIHDILKDTEVFLDETKRDLERYEKLNSKKVTAKLIAEVTKELKLSDKLAETATNRFNLETGGSSEPFSYVDLDGNLRSGRVADPTLFTLYNAINFAIYNENIKEPLENKQKKDSMLLLKVESMLN